MRGPTLVLTETWRTTCIVLQLVPVPGVGAIIAGIKNPHSGLRGRGISQTILVVLGSWPLIIPGAIGLAWAIWDSVRIARLSRLPNWSRIAPKADPETVQPTRQQVRAAKAAQRAEAKAAKEASRARRGEARAAARAEKEQRKQAKMRQKGP